MPQAHYDLPVVCAPLALAFQHVHAAPHNSGGQNHHDHHVLLPAVLLPASLQLPGHQVMVAVLPPMPINRQWEVRDEASNMFKELFVGLFQLHST